MSAPRWLRRLADREPMVVVSLALGATGVATAIVVPRVRYAMGLPTEQYYGLEEPNGTLKDTSSARLEWVKPGPGVKPELVARE